MPPVNFSDDQITTILTDEYRRLHDISPHNEDEAKDLERAKDAVKVMKVLHAQNLARAQGQNKPERKPITILRAVRRFQSVVVAVSSNATLPHRILGIIVSTDKCNRL